jgi:hypothetical protein
VWAGAQRVSSERRVRALYEPVVGEQTPQRAEQFLASLVAQNCGVIVAVGDAPVAAAVADRAKYPGTHIVVVGLEIDRSSADATTASTITVLSGLVPAQP